MGLEPFEITSMYKENSIILNSIKEGTIALNKVMIEGMGYTMLK